MKTSAILIAILTSFSLPLHGMFMRVETQDIPVSRLITNLEAKTKAEPTNADLLHQLARAHSIAYSNKLGDADTIKVPEKQPDQVWFGHQPPHVPFHKVTETTDAAKLTAAKTHLKTAIETYRKALAAKPDDSTIMLGLAWCQDQAGEKEQATAGYRKVADAAWKEEGQSNGGFGNFLYVETADYLIPLLDATKDADELAMLEKRKQTLLSLPRAVTPIAIPLNPQHTTPADLIDRKARVHFDLDGTGRKPAWQWITTDAAWLVFDPKQSGKITSSIQMFGNRSFLLFCNDGYEALSLLDDDADGSICGSELSGLALWRDLDSNGISDPGEVLPVSQHKITSLSTTAHSHSSGIRFSSAGVTFEDGSTRPSYDLILESEKARD